MQRFGLPADVSRAVRFLCSDDAAHMHGHNLVVDDGWLSGVAPTAFGESTSQASASSTLASIRSISSAIFRASFLRSPRCGASLNLMTFSPA